MVRYMSFRRRAHSEGLVNPHEVVMEEMESKSGLKAQEPFGEGIGESCKPTHPHAHCQVLTLDQTGRNVLVDRGTSQSFRGPDASKTNGHANIAITASVNIDDMYHRPAFPTVLWISALSDDPRLAMRRQKTFR